MQRRKQPIQRGPCRAPGTPNHHARCPQDCHPAPIQQICTLTSGPLLGRGKAWERLKGQTSKEQQLPRSGVCVCWAGAGSQQATVLRSQITRFQDMALDRVPQRVGVVGYGRLGEFLSGASSPDPLLKHPKPPFPPQTHLSSMSLSAPWLCLPDHLPFPTTGFHPSLCLCPPLSVPI